MSLPHVLEELAIGVAGGLLILPVPTAAAYVIGRRYSMHRVLETVDNLANQIRSDRFNPDYIVAIDRNSTITGGILAGYLGLQTVISAATLNKRDGNGLRSVEIVDGFLECLSALKGKRVLIFIAFNNSGSSLEAVTLRVERKVGEDSDIRTAALYSAVSPRVKPRYLANPIKSNVPITQLMDRMPWATKSWHRVLDSERPR